MKKNILLVLTAITIGVMAIGCSKSIDTGNTSPSSNASNANGSPSTNQAHTTKNTQSDAEIYANKASVIVKEKGDPLEALNIYKKLLVLLPKGHPAREEVFQYIMKSSLEMAQSDDREKIQKGIQIATELNNIEAGDFYIENRLIYGYTSLAKLEAAKKNWTVALDWTKQALMLHFNTEAMRERLVIRIEQAKEDIAKGNNEEAKKFLADVIDIATLESNKAIYQKELKVAQDLMNKISK